jgi:undecaprenyl-diphosphatase
VWQGVILGVAQGLTEWLPISSEGVNTLIQLHFYDATVAEAVTTALWLHVGTLAAAVVYFRKDIAELLRHVPAYLRAPRADTGDERGRLITFLLISTILSGAIGGTLLLVGLAEALIRTDVVSAVIGGLLIVTAIVQRQARRRLSAGRTTVGWKDGVLLGVVQALAVFPGLSRSGLTVSALLFRGYQAERAVRLSFLMGIPVVLVAGVGLNITRDVSFNAPSMAGLGAAFVLGLATIGILLRVAARVQFWKFCLVLGAISFVPLLLEAL